MNAFQKARELFDDLRQLSARHNVIIVMPPQKPKRPEFTYVVEPILLPRTAPPADKRMVFTVMKRRDGQQLQDPHVNQLALY